MTIGGRLKEWRAFKNLNQKDASSISGVSFSTYQNYEMDISPPGAKSLQGFINAGINANWLMMGHGPMLLEMDRAAIIREDEIEDKKLIEELAVAETFLKNFSEKLGVEIPKNLFYVFQHLMTIDNFIQPTIEEAIKELSGYIDRFSMIPFYDVEASAGAGSLVEQELKTSEMAFRKDWLRFKGLQISKCALIKAKGDSMEPTIHDGDLLLVDTSIDAIKDDSIYIVQTEHHLIVKRIQQDWDGSLIVISDNPRYEKRIIGSEQVKEVKIAGRVRWYGHEI